MIFYALTYAWRQGLQHTLRGPADVNVSEKHVWSLLLHNKILSCNNTWKCCRKCSKNFFFPVPIMPRKSMLHANVFKAPFPGQMLTSFWYHRFTFATLHITDDDVKFCDGRAMLISKTTKPCINSTWIALLIHRFVPIKTLLLIFNDINIYAIICIIA